MARRPKRRRKRAGPSPGMVALPASHALVETMLRACWRDHRLRSHLYWSLVAGEDAGTLDPVGAWLAGMIESMQDAIRMGSPLAPASTVGVAPWSAVMGTGRLRPGEVPSWYTSAPAPGARRRKGESPLAGLAAGLRKLAGKRKRRRRPPSPAPAPAEVRDKRADVADVGDVEEEWSDEALMQKLEEVRGRESPAGPRRTRRKKGAVEVLRDKIRQDQEQAAAEWEMVGEPAGEGGPPDQRADTGQMPIPLRPAGGAQAFHDEVSAGQFQHIGVESPGPDVLDEMMEWAAEDDDEISAAVGQWREGYDVTVEDVELAVEQLEVAHHADAERLGRLLSRCVADSIADHIAGIREEE